MADGGVCVTGSTQGIGYAIAEAFARGGARLVINSHEPDHSGATGRLSRLTECHFVQADLSARSGTQQLIDGAKLRLGRINTLVCNAGTFRDADFASLSEEAVDQTFDLNVKGYLYCAQAFAACLEPGQEGSSIVCVGSTNSRAAEKDSVAYDASKGAVLMLVRSLAVSLADKGIRVNGVGPGIVETPLTEDGLNKGDTRKGLVAQIPLGRIGMPDDVGDAVVFLASPQARYITGQMLYIDGGILANQMTWDLHS
ncbi:MAG: SDR family oxidoreductase [Pseudomonadota bacterium]